MSRLASNKTTRPLLYGAMGSGILVALLPFALVLGTSPAQATTQAITQSFSAPVDTCQGTCGRKWRGEVLAGRRSSRHGYYQRNHQRK